jgi:predicted metal-dependent phosphoesterase TrpH
MQSGDLAGMLDAAVSRLARDLARTITQESRDAVAPDVAEALSVLVAVHWVRYQLLPEGKDHDDLQACLKWSAALLPVAPEQVPEPVRAHLAGPDTPADATAAEANDRGADLYENYQQTGNVQFLQTAITHFGEAVDATPVGHPDRPGMLSNLGAALRARFGLTGRQPDLDQAITCGREAVHTTPDGHPERPRMLSNLANALQNRFERAGQQPDLDQAITLLSEAADATPADHPDRPGMLSNLGAALRARFGLTGQQPDLDQAITCGREAVDATPADHPARPRRLSNLGSALRARFGRTGQQPDLDQAITCFREAVDAIPDGHPGRPGILSNLGNALQDRFGRTGQQADLDQAITCGREAVDAAPAGHPERLAMLSSLGNALRARFERAGQQPDLDQAITRLSEAADAIPADHPARPGMLSSLGNVLQDRFGRTGQQADLDQAITCFREAVDATPAGHPERPAMLSSLGSALRARFGRNGQQADLDQAITCGREAVDATPAGHPERPAMLSNLGAALRARFGLTGQQPDLDQAITYFRQAVDTIPAGHPNRSVVLSNLGVALRTRFERTGQQADVDQALEVFRQGAGVLTASPRRRVAAARGWGECALLAGIPGSAVEGYTAAIELLPLVAWHGLDQATREHHLREWAGLASDAAAAAVTAGHPAKGVELLEAGRSILWTQALHLRQDLATLQERAPGLAAMLGASRAILNTSSTGLPHGMDTVGNVDQARAAEQQMLEERRKAARDWDAAVDQVRRIEGFEHFLRPVPFADLRAAASAGSVVIVNISQHGSHALVVTSATGPTSVPAVMVVDLPDAPMSIVIDQANTLLAVLHRTGDPATDWRTKEEDRHAVFKVLAWSWQAITEPVLTALSHTHSPWKRIEDWPRVWWCPTGPATVLPLHAAGRHPRTTTQYAAIGEASALADSVAGRVISSYTQTLTTLAQTRIRPAPGQVRQLAVGVPEAPGYTPGASSLPAVPDELQVVARYLPTPEHATHLLGPTATQQAVLEALPSHSWLHLSCHGVQHPADASLSAFLLHDQPLTLADLTALNLDKIDLAYLAACETATGDVRLLDEALHLAGALQLVGYRHVLATLWSISDAAAPAMADITYAYLLHSDPDHSSPTDRPQADRAPFALHHAVTRLRRACPDEPLLWAPYIHLGP